MSLPTLLSLPLLAVPCADLAEYSRVVMQARQLNVPIEAIRIDAEAQFFITVGAYQQPLTGEWFYTSLSYSKTIEGICHAANR